MYSPTAIEPRITTKEILVRQYHLDSYHHVNNMRYLEFLEEARWAHFENCDAIRMARQGGLGILIASYDLNYKYQAQLGQVLRIETSVAEINRCTIIFLQQIFLKGTDQKVLDGKIKVVTVNTRTQRPSAIPDDIRYELFR
ncbi:thioesterase family protein [Limibacter armeniacum]|uniref:acyl-CoA thioesterase n=1 Tax=Limibacter armeniacum TaxID=466084 RepID=UPI002FE5C1AA